MLINKNEITKEMIEKALQCQTADELIALAKTGGYEITKEEADAYLAELADVELDEGKLKKVSGGGRNFVYDAQWAVPSGLLRCGEKLYGEMVRGERYGRECGKLCV